MGLGGKEEGEGKGKGKGRGWEEMGRVGRARGGMGVEWRGGAGQGAVGQGGERLLNFHLIFQKKPRRSRVIQACIKINEKYQLLACYI